jgi:hypothetical protein
LSRLRRRRLPLIERVLAAGGLAGLLSLLGCTSNVDATPGSLAVLTGQETDTWTLDPTPSRAVLELVGANRTTLATATPPVTEISLGVGDPPEASASFELTAFDTNDQAVIRGTSVPYSIVTFESAFPSLFAARTGGFSRAPGNLVFGYRHPLAEIVSHAYLLVAGGEPTDSAGVAIDVYDMANWVVAPKQSWLPRAPKSWAVAGSSLLVIDDAGAIWVDLPTGTSSAATLPSGLDFADLVGGDVILGAKDERYIIGATRTSGAPSDRALRLDTDGTLRALTLNTPRLGAAAANIDGQIVIVGGSDTGAGGEVLNADQTAFKELPFAADATVGAALAKLTTDTAILVGGTDPSSGARSPIRTLDLTCTDSCSATPLAKLDFDYDRARAFYLSDNRLLVAGESSDGQSHAFTLDKTIGFELTEQALRNPRTEASFVKAPNGQLGFVGGDNLADGSPITNLELFFPTQ